MEGWEVFLIVVLVLIVIGIIIVIILAAAGVFEAKNDFKKFQEIIRDPFSLRQLFLGNKNAYMTKAQGNSSLILSSDSSIQCKDYSWTYNSEQKLIWGGNGTGIVAASSATDGASVTIVTPSSTSNPPVSAPSDALSQWIYTDKFRWCLKSNPKLCLVYENNVISLKTESDLNRNFAWEPTKPIVSPACT